MPLDIPGSPNALECVMSVGCGNTCLCLSVRDGACTGVPRENKSRPH